MIAATVTDALTDPKVTDTPGHRARVLLTAELAANAVFLADARARGQAARIALLEQRERVLWDSMSHHIHEP